jgi:hypothetical protein
MPPPITILKLHLLSQLSWLLRIPLTLLNVWEDISMLNVYRSLAKQRPGRSIHPSTYLKK